MPQYSTKQDFLRFYIFTSDYACLNTRKLRVIREKLNHCQKAILERDQLRASPQSSPKINHMLITNSFPYDESRHDSYSQFPRSPLGTPGTTTVVLCTKYEGKKNGLCVSLITKSRLIISGNLQVRKELVLIKIYKPRLD